MTNLNHLDFQEGFNSKPYSCWRANEEGVIREKNGVIIAYSFGRKCGSGAFGTVLNLNPPTDLRRKVCKISKNDLQHEYQLSMKWNNKTEGLSIHPKAYFPKSDQFNNMIILHRYDKTLDRLIFNNKLTWQDKIEAICQISQGLTTLHSLHISHNDVYECNVMYDHYLKRYDLIDFGRSKLHKSNEEFIDGVIVDIKALTSVIFNLMGGSPISNGTFSQPTQKQIEQFGFTPKQATHLYEICEHLPKTAQEIHAVFKQFQQMATKEQ